VADDPRVQQLLDEICDAGCTPEEVCRACSELLPEIRRRWLQMRIVEAIVIEPASTFHFSTKTRTSSNRNVPLPATKISNWPISQPVRIFRENRSPFRNVTRSDR
jgi:hypothetical protein